MRVLVAGGTGFLGAACVRQAQAAGYQVTVLTRSGRNVPRGAATIIADRCAPLPPLAGRFDAVIDTKAYQPAMVTHLIAALRDPVPYAMASSLSVYDELRLPGATEQTPASVASHTVIAKMQALPPQDWCNLQKIAQHYGPLKRACEELVKAWSPQQAAIHRLGLICGPGDRTDRLTWWVRVLDQGAAVPVPGPQHRRVQLIDVDDAAAFMVQTIAQGRPRQGGTFNVTGPSMPFADLLRAIVSVTGSNATCLPVPEAAIAAENLQYWTELPLILPSDGPKRAMLDVATSRARAAGLTTRPLSETLARALAYDRTDRERPLVSGLSADQMRRLLAHHSPSG